MQKTTQNHPSNQRQTEFEKLYNIATRNVNMIEVATEDSKIVADAYTILRKIRGELSKPQTKENLEGQEIMEAHSNSQQS